MYKVLIDCNTLNAHLGDPQWVIVDCRFDLFDPAAGRKAYLHNHIPGAVYAHLDQDLSGPPVTNRSRHPLPLPEALIALFGRLGIDRTKQVLVYDSASGSVSARLWWLLRYMGHENVAVLDGGWPVWLEAGLPVRSGEETNPQAVFSGEPHTDQVVIADAIPQAPLLIDSRDPARYRGEYEPIDPVAGHIPGAMNHFWKLNLDTTGRLLSPDRLREHFKQILAQTPSSDAVFYCGSGVTACQNLLAVAHAGLPDARLYAGSWSEWCADPARPVATGDE
ncbi:MAG: sulfurtransferase [Pseudomonadota bacterium]|nr:sulfurtransferase [Pseudomonadota bacterium]